MNYNIIHQLICKSNLNTIGPNLLNMSNNQDNSQTATINSSNTLNTQNTQNTQRISTVTNAHPVGVPIVNATTIQSGTHRTPYVINASVLPPHEPVVFTDQLRQEVINTYALGRTIRWLSGFDIFLSFIYCIYNPYFLIPLFLAFSGYYGAKTYKTTYATLYMIYILLNSFTRFGIFMYVLNNLDISERNDHWFDFMLVLISCLISLWVSKIIYMFNKIIKTLTEDELELLRQNRVTTQSRMVILW